MAASASTVLGFARVRVRPAVAVFALFVGASVYHGVMSIWHATPAIFIDELLYTKLAQSLAAGDGLTVRGEPVFFPGLMPVLLQAPAWLLPDAGAAYAVAKIVNAVVMASAVLPAYWLGRQLLSARHALWVAALTAASPALLYHAYLMSEALAYPVFLLAVATMTRTLSRPSRRWQLAVLGVFLLAVTTRVQFVALPAAYLVAVPLVARLRGESVRAALRRHALSVGALGGMAALVLVTGGVALGPYIGAALLEYDLSALVHWGGLTALLVPFGVAVALLPGAVLGLWALRRHSSGFGVLTTLMSAATLLQIALVAGGQAERPLERYAIYLAPLLVVAFFAYAEAGATRARAYTAIAVVLGLGAWVMPFPSLAPIVHGYNFSFDSPTLSAYGTAAISLGHPNAATIFSGGAFLLCALAVAARRRPQLIAAAALAALAAMGGAAYAGDRAMTSQTRAQWAAGETDWLDRERPGRVDYIALPGAHAHYGYILEVWNDSFGHALLWPGEDDVDPFADRQAKIGPGGTLLVDGRPAPAGTIALNEFGSRIELEGEVVAAPKPWLRVVRVPAGPRVRSLASGLAADGWTSARELRYQIFGADAAEAGVFRARLGLPEGRRARDVVLAVDGGPRRRVQLEPGRSLSVQLQAPPQAVRILRIESLHTDFVGAFTQNPRFVGVQVLSLGYRPNKGP